MKHHENSDNRTLLTVRQFATKHPAFTEGSLRFNIFNSEKNGFSKCIRRIGRKILLDESEFFKWVDEQNNHLMARQSTRAGTARW